MAVSRDNMPHPSVDNAELDPRWRRVAVIGTSCSGKTTFASRLSKLLDVRHIELDTLYWGPNWTARPSDDFRRDTAEAVAEAVGGIKRGLEGDEPTALFVFTSSDHVAFDQLPQEILRELPAVLHNLAAFLEKAAKDDPKAEP